MTLAIHGGKPVRRLPMPPRPPYGIAERNAANSVVASGNLSGFLANPGEAFLGGPKVRDLEAAFCEKFGVKYAVAMNSGSSCLDGAVKALGIGPGDEVIVTPWSMSASATCVLKAGATPVFADIEPETYGLDATSVAKAVTPKTRAIVLVDLFGCPARDTGEIATWGIPIIEDAAQAVGASAFDLLAGTCADIGVFSLNRHKTIECGEGGIAVATQSNLAQRLRDYRNHGEVRRGMLGGNYRLPEVSAAIAEVQLDRLEELTEPRIYNAGRLTEVLSELDGITPPHVPEGLRHVYYLYAVRVPDAANWAKALTAEGIPTSTYVEPLYHLPAFLPSGSPKQHWCPEAERACREVVVIPHVHAGMTDGDIDDAMAAFVKIWRNRGAL